MTADILETLLIANLAAAGAIVLLLLLGPAIRRGFGARMAYAAWLLVPATAAATLLPARKIFTPATAPSADASFAVVIAQAPAFDWSLVVFAAWAAGAIVLIALTFWTQSRTLGLIGALTPEDGRLRAANPAIGPAIVGILRPRIMLPADFEHRFDVAEQAVIMAHEETHLAAGDQWINAAVELGRCLFWFNPLVHLAARRVRIDQELACDEAVIARFPKARRTYAEALLKTQVTSAPLPLGCYWPERSHNALKERLTMLTLKTPGRARRIAGAACLAALGLGTGYAAWAAAPETVAMPAPEPATAAAPTPAAEPTPAPAPAPQSLTNAAPPAPPSPPALPEGGPNRAAIFRGPLPEGVEPGANVAIMSGRLDAGSAEARALGLSGADGMAIRIECHKVDDGAVTCSKNGAPVEGAELERLQAMFAAGVPGGGRGDASATYQLRSLPAGEGRTVINIQGRRPAE